LMAIGLDLSRIIKSLLRNIKSFSSPGNQTKGP
jgi:hypothetical protein